MTDLLKALALHHKDFGRQKASFLIAALLCLLFGLSASSPQAQVPPSGEADILIKGGRVIDGTGGPWMLGNVAIKGNTIVYVGRAPVRARRIIDATGLIVAPGFFDMHTHSEYGLAVDGRALSKVTQGVTTEVLGEHLSGGPVLGHAVDDPMEVAPPVHRTWTTLGGWLNFLEKKKTATNVVSYVGAGQIRASVVGYDDRAATPGEIDQEKKLVAQAMQEGAFGLSSGVVYVPNSYMTTEEMVQLAKVASSYGGIFSGHMRGGNEGLQEFIRIGREAAIPVEIFHLNSSTSPETVGPFVQAINQARDAGVDITANAYPYTAGWTYLRQLLPAWAREGDAKEIVARLKQPGMRERAISELQQAPARGGAAAQRGAAPAGQPSRYAATHVSSADASVDGQTLGEIAAARHTSPEAVLVDLVIAQNGEGFYVGDFNPARELQNQQALNNPWVDIGSDGIALTAGVHTAFGKPHPRSFGTHPRVLGHDVREVHLFSLEEAIRKMTSLPADRLGVADRGILRQGMKADVVVFDANTVSDTATVAQPEQYAKGIPWVFVNGTAVVANGTPTNALPGRILRGPGYRPGTP